MLKDYQTFDNIFNEPLDVVKVAKSLPYFSNENSILPGLTSAEELLPAAARPMGGWSGYRTPPLNIFYPSLHDSLVDQILRNIFPNVLSFESEIFTFFHFSTKVINANENKWWHRDSIDKKQFLAGVVYLTPGVENIPGTILRLNDQEVNLKYRFNRLSIYKTNILHRPGQLFGASIDTARLTFTFFIKSLKLN